MEKLLSSIVKSIFMMIFKDSKRFKIGILFEVLSIFISLLIYFYTSKFFSTEFVKSLSLGENYFNFILLGELFIGLPLFFIENPIRQLSISIQQETFLTSMLLPTNKMLFFFYITLHHLDRVALRFMATLLLAILFFPVKIELTPLFNSFIFTLFILPFSFSLGVLVSSLYVYFGKGLGLVGHITAIISILSGVFFPTNVLPIEFSLLHILPHHLFLEIVRATLGSHLSTTLVMKYITCCLISLVFFPISYWVFNFSIQKAKCRISDIASSM